MDYNSTVIFREISSLYDELSRYSTMAKVINLTDTPSLLSHIVSEIRDKEIQQDRMRFPLEFNTAW